MTDEISDRYDGPCGTAEALTIPTTPGKEEGLVAWLLTAPMAHPFWTQYHLYACKLTDDLPGYPPVEHMFDGSTHEVVVYALNPEVGTQTRESMEAAMVLGDVPVLMGPNVVEQFKATDDEMVWLVGMAAEGVTTGALNPDSDGRAAWLPVLTKTLAHFRGEIHAT